jgi:hypothetical protein
MTRAQLGIPMKMDSGLKQKIRFTSTNIIRVKEEDNYTQMNIIKQMQLERMQKGLRKQH